MREGGIVTEIAILCFSFGNEGESHNFCFVNVACDVNAMPNCYWQIDIFLSIDIPYCVVLSLPSMRSNSGKSMCR